MRRSLPLFRLVLVALALLAALALSGCGGMWDAVRENERGFALENARNQSKRGKCVEALEALDRAEAIMSIDRFAIEATQIRIRCYEKLGLPELQAAHRRLLEDFYTEEPMAFPAADGSSVFRASEDVPTQFDRPPSWLKIERPRYTPYAQRSKIVGRVVVKFGLGRGRDDEPDPRPRDERIPCSRAGRSKPSPRRSPSGRTRSRSSSRIATT